MALVAKAILLVTYVANIYKYYIAYQLVTQAEAQKREAREQIQKPSAK